MIALTQDWQRILDGINGRVVKTGSDSWQPHGPIVQRIERVIEGRGQLSPASVHIEGSDGPVMVRFAAALEITDSFSGSFIFHRSYNSRVPAEEYTDVVADTVVTARQAEILAGVVRNLKRVVASADYAPTTERVTDIVSDLAGLHDEVSQIADDLTRMVGRIRDAGL